MLHHLADHLRDGRRLEQHDMAARLQRHGLRLRQRLVQRDVGQGGSVDPRQIVVIDPGPARPRAVAIARAHREHDAGRTIEAEGAGAGGERAPRCARLAEGRDVETAAPGTAHRRLQQVRQGVGRHVRARFDIGRARLVALRPERRHQLPILGRGAGSSLGPRDHVRQRRCVEPGGGGRALAPADRRCDRDAGAAARAVRGAAARDEAQVSVDVPIERHDAGIGAGLRQHPPHPVFSLRPRREHSSSCAYRIEIPRNRAATAPCDTGAA